jgi:Fe-S-cluster containining protein
MDDPARARPRMASTVGGHESPASSVASTGAVDAGDRGRPDGSTPNPSLSAAAVMSSREADELERQLRHASFFTQAGLEQHGKLASKLDVYVTSLVELLLERGLIDTDALAAAVESNRQSQAAEHRARYETDGTLPAWPAVMVREDAPPPAPDGSDDGHANGDGQEAAAAPEPVEVEVDCEARMHICKAACCTLPFPLSADEIEAGKVKWDLGHPYVIRQSAEGYCVHNDGSTGGCSVYDHRPGVCRAYSCAGDERIWLDFDNMVLNEDYLRSRRRPDYQFKPATADAVPVTITRRTSTRRNGSAEQEPREPREAVTVA